MNKRIVVNIIIIILIIALGIVLIDEFRGGSEREGSTLSGYQEEDDTQETEETQKPIEIKDNKDGGFSELIPLKPINP